jgi:hypothetical protein
MLTHIVCFKYRSDIPESTRADHRARLRRLANIDGIVELVVGADVVHSPRSYDTAVLVVFRDRAALDAYQVDPEHVPVSQFGTSIAEHVVSVDF